MKLFFQENILKPMQRAVELNSEIINLATDEEALNGMANNPVSLDLITNLKS